MFVEIIGFLKCGFKMLCLLFDFSAKRNLLLPWKKQRSQGKWGDASFQWKALKKNFLKKLEKKSQKFRE